MDGLHGMSYADSFEVGSYVLSIDSAVRKITVHGGLYSEGERASRPAK